MKLNKNNQVKVLAAATGFAVAALLTFSGSAQAADATSNLSVTATVTANCSISTTPVAFGSYDPVAGGNVLQQGSVSIACTKNSAPSVTLGLGSNASGSTRRMKGGTSGDVLNYELYQPTTTAANGPCPTTFGSGTVWGTTGANIFTPTTAPSKDSRTYYVCGQLASGQDVSADSYSDTVVATVNY